MEIVLGVTGGSYGGFMTNWVITQTPRFRAAVASASLSNLISFYSTSLYQDLVHVEFGGYPGTTLICSGSGRRYVMFGKCKLRRCFFMERTITTFTSPRLRRCTWD
mgnify:CR=1 FL=1